MENLNTHSIQPKEKKRYGRYLLFLFKILSAGGVSFFFSLLGHVLIGYSWFSFMFVFLTVWFAFFTLVGKLQLLGVLAVDVLFILIILLLRMYITMAWNG